MGYGKNLKQALDDNHMTVKELSQLADVSATTLYSCIQRDSSVRFDIALRIATILNIDINTICKMNPFTDLGSMSEYITKAVDQLSEKNYISYTQEQLLPIIKLFEYQELNNITQLISLYYSLDQDGRTQVFDMIEVTSRHHTNPERSKKLKELKQISESE